MNEMTHILILSTLIASMSIQVCMADPHEHPPHQDEWKDIKTIAQRDDGKLIIGTKSRGAFISNQDISEWETQSFGFDGPEALDVKSLIVLDNGMILAGTKNGVYRSKEGGEFFVLSSTGLEGSPESLDARFLLQDPVTPMNIHLATKGGYYFSRDRGKTWQKQNQGLNTAHEYDTKAIAVVSEPYSVFLGTHDGLFKTSDPENGSWVSLKITEHEQNEVKAMAVNSDQSSLILFVKSSNPSTWYEKVVETITQEEQEHPPAVISLYRTDNGGETFTLLTLPHSTEIKEFGFAFSPTNPNDILAGGKNGMLYHSTDKGNTWKTISIQGLDQEILDQEIKAVYRDPQKPDQTWYVATKDGFFKTHSGGDHFVSVNDGLKPEPLPLEPVSEKKSHPKKHK